MYVEVSADGIRGALQNGYLSLVQRLRRAEAVRTGGAAKDEYKRAHIKLGGSLDLFTKGQSFMYYNCVIKSSTKKPIISLQSSLDFYS
jgi:hypothetical protein